MAADARQVSAPTTLEAGLRYAARGWNVFPVKGNKNPYTAHGFQDATTDPAIIRAWWGEKWPSGGVAIATGQASRIVVLDVDPGGEESLAALVAKHEPLPATLEAHTPRGRHFYFALAPGQVLRNSAGTLGAGLDVRGDGGYVVVPPTPGYAWTDEIEPAPLPDWLAKLICELAKKSTAPISATETEKIREGQRNTTLASLAGAMRRKGATEGEILAALLTANRERCDPPLSEQEVKKIAASIARYEPTSNATAPGQAPTPVLTPDQAPAMLADLLFQIGGFFSSYLAISTAQTHVLAIWVFHTHTIEAVDRTPYLHVRSPEKRCGKSLLLDLLKLLVRNPWRTSNASPAAIPRKIAMNRPTALFDEADTYIRAEDERGETLRGVLDAGFERGGAYSRCIGQGAALKVADFDLFCPKAIAGLRDLPDTIADRSIPVRMKRALPGEIRKRFYRREAEPAAAKLREHIEACAAALLPELKSVRPERVLELNDRQNDIVEPLLAIADLAGDGWPEYLRRFMRELFQAEEESEQSLGIRLLSDLRVIFDERDIERLASADLVQALRERPDAPWADWRGKGITTHMLTRMLRSFQIEQVRWLEGKTTRGYERKTFTEAWARYLPAHLTEGGQSVKLSEPRESTS